MKKILFATTALVATAGYASADITFTGAANMGVKYQEDRMVNGVSADETFLYTELDFSIVGSGTTDSGIEFGASVDIDSTSDDGVNSVNEAAYNPTTYISSGGLTLTIGELDGVSDPFGLPDIGFDGVGVDDVAEDLYGGVQGVKAGANVNVSYTFGDYTFNAASDVDDSWGVSFTGSVNAFTFGIAYEENEDVTPSTGVAAFLPAGVDSADISSTWLNLGYSFDAFTVGAFYVDMDIDLYDGGVDAGSESEEGYGLSASYTAGDLTVTGVWADSSTADDGSYGIDAAYALGTGLVLKGGVASVNDNTHADLGVIMSF
ncbi:porin [Ferrimonas balearica]|nr:porin [Ferrimonas balearica]